MDSERRRDFIREIVRRDVERGTYGGRVVTRWPPEPNGYPHIGHAKSIVLNFGIAEEFGGRCHLRFDDTNPEGESMEYVEAIMRDVRWLGYDWGEHLYFASDYFEQLYAYAEALIRAGKAYVCSLSLEQIRASRGSVTEPGTPSPYRERSVEENLDLFRRMRAGEFPDGAHVLRAKIDMASPNMLLRDPLLYRIRHKAHYRRGTEWCIYPMYDFAHCLSDAIEGVTHSICTLEFENNRALYDWILENTPGIEQPRPHQYEFARLDLSYTVMSKRKLKALVEAGVVSGWDDPRMPTLAGLRRRGVRPEAIRAFCERIGVTNVNSTVDMALFEHTIREDLNHEAPRLMAVARPLKVVLENWPEGESQWIDAPLWPRDVPREGTRAVPFGRELWIERTDFRERPPEGWRRLAPGREVRLRYAYVIRCEGLERDPETGEVTALRCRYLPETRGGRNPEGRTVEGTIHWVSCAHAQPAELQLVDRLFSVPDPDAELAAGRQLTELVHPGSLEVVTGWVEPRVAELAPGERVQFERLGYFYAAPEQHRPGERLVFVRIVPLKDRWAAREQERAREALERARAEKAREKEQQRRRTQQAARRPEELPAPSPELARARERFMARWGLGAREAALLTREDETAALFEASVEAGAPAEAAARWILNEVAGLRRQLEVCRPLAPEALARLIGLVEAGRIGGPAAKRVLATMLETGEDPEAIVEREGLERIDDAGALEAQLEAIWAAHP
ncbi:MAG: glutamine--tRNA ligase/YqeY domain fusion protein, partial [Planctomycetota bacterium]